MSHRKAFTLIELIVVIAIASALMAIVVPRSSRFLDRIEVSGAVTEIESLFFLARHAAIARGTQVTLDIDNVGGTVSLRAGNELIQSRPVGAAHKVTLYANRTSIVYSATGVGYGAANLSLIVARNRVVDTIVVSRLGRVRH